MRYKVRKCSAHDYVLINIHIEPVTCTQIDEKLNVLIKVVKVVKVVKREAVFLSLLFL